MPKHNEDMTKPHIIYFDITCGSSENKRPFGKSPYIIFQFRKGKPVHPHRHTQMELWFVQDGYGKVNLNYNTYQLRPGSIVFINSNVLHSMSESDAAELEYFCLVADYSFMEEYGIDRNFLFEEVFHDNEICNFMIDIYQNINKRTEYMEIAIKNSLSNIAVNLIQKHYLIPAAVSLGENQNHSELVKDIIDYIQDNYLSHISLNKLAAENKISKCYMCRVFKEITGDTVLSYINHLRCIRAEFLIQTENISVSNASEMCGFKSAAYFSKVFKKVYGYPPSEAKMSNKK